MGATSFIQHIHVVYTHKTSNVHPIQEFNMFMIIYEENRIAELNTRILILRRIFPATSYVPATFHPTIGQRSHQSLSITATPELGMIPQGTREITGSHIAQNPKHPQSSQHTVGFHRLLRKLAKNTWVPWTYPAKPHSHQTQNHPI